MTKECKASEKQSALIHPNKSFYAPLRFVSGRLSLEARYIFDCRLRSRLRNPFMITREVEAQAGVVLCRTPGQ